MRREAKASVINETLILLFASCGRRFIKEPPQGVHQVTDLRNMILEESLKRETCFTGVCTHPHPRPPI